MKREGRFCPPVGNKVNPYWHGVGKSLHALKWFVTTFLFNEMKLYGEISDPVEKISMVSWKIGQGIKIFVGWANILRILKIFISSSVIS